MKNIKTWFSSFVLITVVWFSSMGCVTKGLWDQSSSSSYKDTIIAFYTNPQKNEIIFLGEKYHYFFKQGTAPLNELLKFRDFLGLQKNNLHINTYIDKDAHVHSSISVTFNLENISQKQRIWLHRHKFAQIGTTPFTSRSFNLTGKHYRADLAVNEQAVKIKEPIAIEVSEHSNNTIGKVLLTPLAVGADAVLVVAGVIVLPFVMLTK